MLSANGCGHDHPGAPEVADVAPGRLLPGKTVERRRMLDFTCAQDQCPARSASVTCMATNNYSMKLGTGLASARPVSWSGSIRGSAREARCWWCHRTITETSTLVRTSSLARTAGAHLATVARCERNQLLAPETRSLWQNRLRNCATKRSHTQSTWRRVTSL
jgi:hypothetical protein